MTLTNKLASILLTDEGRTVLSVFQDEDVPVGLFAVKIFETEDLGLWVKSVRDGKPRLVLLRWEYVLALDVTDGPDSKLIGLKGAV